MMNDSGNRTKIKICGLTTLEDARFVSGALADYLGFIFYPESPRYIEPAKAGAINNWLEGPQKVGVFVNQPLDDVNAIAKQTGLDIVQLHGVESPGYCHMIDLPVIKVFHISPGMNAEELSDEIDIYKNVADYFLFDTKADHKWGGTGQTFDWSILRELNHQAIPFFLSGGINIENAEDAIRSVQPYAIDVASGLEESPGKKDFEKTELFFDKMREIWEGQEDGSF